MSNTCDNCYRSFDEDDSNAYDSYNYCSRSCEIDDQKFCSKCGHGYNVGKSSASNSDEYCSYSCESADTNNCIACGSQYLIPDSSAYNSDEYCSSSCERADDAYCDHCGSYYKISDDYGYIDDGYCSSYCRSKANKESCCIVCNHYYFVASSSANNNDKYCSLNCELHKTHSSQYMNKQVNIDNSLQSAVSTDTASSVGLFEDLASDQSETTQTLPKPTTPRSKHYMAKIENSIYFDEVKTIVIVLIIFSIIYQWSMRHYISLSHVFHESIYKGLYYVVLYVAEFGVIAFALFQILKGILIAPISRFKHYMLLTIVLLLMLIAEYYFIGFINAWDVVQQIIHFVKYIKVSIEHFFTWLQSNKLF